jgi:predicted permease
VALGATRTRLLVLNLVESLVLAVLGGVLALVLARWGVTLILSMLPLATIPAPLAFQLDARVLGFAALLSVLSALLFGLAPGLRDTHLNVAGALRSSQGGAPPRSVRHLGRVLMAFQVGLSVLLLVGAGLFLQTLRNLAHVEIGFNPDKLLQVLIDTRGAGYRRGDVGGVHGLMLDRIGSIPGVLSVTSVRNPIMRGAMSRGLLQLPGLTTSPEDFWDSADVGPGFFETLGIPLLRGRTFTPPDFKSHRGIVVNDAWVRKYFPNEDPVAMGIGVLGVVGNVRLAGVRAPSAPMVFQMTSPELDRLNSLLVRSEADPAAVVPAIREALRAINPRLLIDVRTMRQEIATDIATERMVAATSSFFGVLGLLLVSIGIFGVASYTVAQRTTELGIRMALGAGRWTVIRDSLQDTVIVFGAGLAVGIVAAFVAVRLMANLVSDLLFGLRPTDTVSIVLAVLLMATVALVACILPARYATRIDPLTAIRCE